MSDLKKLHDAAFAITPLIVKPEYAHMKQPWEMILGGLIIPAMVKEDPDCLKNNDKFKALMEKYSAEKVNEFFAPKVKEKIVEKIITKEKKVSVVVAGGVKHRRLKKGVSKTVKKTRDFLPADRNDMIIWWNMNQRLMDKVDDECQKVVMAIHQHDVSLEPLAPAQVAGFISRLSDMGLKHNRDEIAQKWVSKGMCTVAPKWSKEFLDAIEKNYNEQREDEAQRAKDHAKIRNGEGYTPQPKGTVLIAEKSNPGTAPAESFDILSIS